MISLGEFKEENSKKLKKLLTLDKSKDKTLIIKSSLEFMDDTTDFENAFLITKLDKLKFKEIKELRKRLDFLNLRIKGIIVMN